MRKVIKRKIIPGFSSVGNEQEKALLRRTAAVNNPLHRGSSALINPTQSGTSLGGSTDFIQVQSPVSLRGLRITIPAGPLVQTDGDIVVYNPWAVKPVTALTTNIIPYALYVNNGVSNISSGNLFFDLGFYIGANELDSRYLIGSFDLAGAAEYAQPALSSIIRQVTVNEGLKALETALTTFRAGDAIDLVYTLRTTESPGPVTSDGGDIVIEFSYMPPTDYVTTTRIVVG